MPLLPALSIHGTNCYGSALPHSSLGRRPSVSTDRQTSRNRRSIAAKLFFLGAPQDTGGTGSWICVHTVARERSCCDSAMSLILSLIL